MSTNLTEFLSEESTVVTSNEHYSIENIAKNEWLDFAMYTVESRAIPNMIDGLKPVNRFYLYSSIKNSKTDFKKVSAVSGIISDYGYNHGETSAAGAGQLMAATWNNNVCLIEGRGSFGTRLIQEASAARYVYTKLHSNFFKYIKDIELSPTHEDPEHEPPAFYLPIIPLVLANGTKGIATGFATNILPRDPKSLKENCVEYIKTGKIQNQPKVKFPDFKGEVEQDANDSNKYLIKGTFKRKTKTLLVIDEVPYGYDRESYVKILDKLEEDNEIVSYEDCCDESGFNFEVKLKQNVSTNWSDDKIVQKFKLSKPITENLTVIDQNGKLKIYDDANSLITDFCDYRSSILEKRIELRKQEFTELERWLTAKMEFIRAVLDDRISFKDKKKSEVEKQIIENTSALKSDIDRLLRLNMLSLTKEMIKVLNDEIRQAQNELAFWKKETPKTQFISDLGDI